MSSKEKKRDILLFVDDEKICHTLVELIVPNFTDLKLVSAYNGEEALQFAKRYANEICMILSDVMLPDTTGYEILEKVSEDKRLKDIPFVFQSGLGPHEDALKNRIGGKVKVLYKPYKQADLIKCINSALHKEK